MATPYDRLKKHRKLKQLTENSVSYNDSTVTDVELDNSNLSENLELEVDDIEHNCGQHVENIYSDYDNTFGDLHNPENIEDCYLTDSFIYNRSPDLSSTDDESPLSFSSSSNSEESSHEENDEGVFAVPTIREKLQSWAVRFRYNLTIETIDSILDILHSENVDGLPKSAVTLLQTKTDKNIRLMMSSKNTNGSYVYFGLESGLKSIITNEFTENTIRLLFNIDGLPLYNNSSQQFWANLGLILHSEYDSQPFIVAVYSGDSKPQDANDFLEDFIKELKILIDNGIVINQRVFNIEIVGFSCDTPARSFIKKCKGHGGFYACERCETRGKTRNKKRVYPNINSRRRTKRSFKKQRQVEHHLGRSPLLDIPKFDPVRSVFLDSMHLLYLGIMKWILQQLIGAKKKVNRKCKLSRRNIRRLNLNLKLLGRFIPKEFQRKKFDFDEFSHWKATQFRFFLHYCGVFVFRKILPKQMYQHFLLLVVSCRILCSPELCVEYTNYARQLSVKFFELLQHFYGSDSQVMNSHNIIHLADDVEQTKTNLCAISAFPFENCLGKIKRLIVGRNNPLAQLVRRMSEQKACAELIKKNAIRKKNNLVINYLHKNQDVLKNIILHGVELSATTPNNIVRLNNGEILSITEIRKEEQGIFLHGFMFKYVTDAFTYPCESTKVGIMKLGRLSRQKKIIPIENFKNKFLFKDNRDTFAVTYLHSS